jgi:hypothetical protein
MMAESQHWWTSAFAMVKTPDAMPLIGVFAGFCSY